MSQKRSEITKAATRQLPARIKREMNTVEAMIQIYCHYHHKSNDALCQQCLELKQYAGLRLEKCTFQEEKPTCGQCPVHCYKPAMREKIKEIMRFSGPRMIICHPLLAIMHLIDKKRSNI